MAKKDINKLILQNLSSAFADNNNSLEEFKEWLESNQKLVTLCNKMSKEELLSHYILERYLFEWEKEKC